MNGTAAEWESDRRPVRLCPGCLRKLFWAVRFDPVARYEALREYYVATGLRDEAAWIGERLPQVDQRR